jgi:hypothetical protein
MLALASSIRRPSLPVHGAQSLYENPPKPPPLRPFDRVLLAVA